MKTLIGLYAALALCALCASATSGCKKKDARQLKDERDGDVEHVQHAPPPVARGKCLVDEYENDIVVKQSCALDGYTWTCAIDDAGSGTRCVRKGQATAEDPPADTTPAAGYFGGATYGVNAAGSPVKMPAHWAGDTK